MRQLKFKLDRNSLEIIYDCIQHLLDQHVSLNEACIGGYQYPISLEVNRKVSHIHLSKLENIPLNKFPKYPISLEVNTNIPEITNAKQTYEYRNIFSSTYFM